MTTVKDFLGYVVNPPPGDPALTAMSDELGSSVVVVRPGGIAGNVPVDGGNGTYSWQSSSGSLLEAATTTVSVNNYGADPTGSVDSTSAIQAAIDAVINAGGGTVIFGSPEGPAPARYLVQGALRTAPTIGTLPGSTSIAGQLVLNSKTGATSITVIRLVGAIPMAFSSYGGALPIASGAYLVSNNAGATYAAHGALPAVISTPDNAAGNVNGFAQLAVVIENLGVQVPTNPAIAALNLSGAEHASINGVKCTTADQNTDFATQPTHPTGIGLVMPANNNNVDVVIGSVQCEGFYQGVVIGECADGGANIDCGWCYSAIGWNPMYHAANLGMVISSHCPYGAAYNDYVGGTGIGASTPSPFATIKIGLFDFEDAASGWNVPIAHYLEPTGGVRFETVYHRVLAGSGVVSTPWTASVGPGSSGGVFARSLDNSRVLSTQTGLSAPQSIPNANASFDAIAWTGTQWNDGGAWSNVHPTRLTAQTPGFYSIDAYIEFAYASSTAGERLAFVRLNGSARLVAADQFSGVNVPGLAMSTKLKMVAGDYIEVMVYQVSSAALNVNGPGTSGVVSCTLTQIS